MFSCRGFPRADGEGYRCSRGAGLGERGLNYRSAEKAREEGHEKDGRDAVAGVLEELSDGCVLPHVDGVSPCHAVQVVE